MLESSELLLQFSHQGLIHLVSPGTGSGLVPVRAQINVFEWLFLSILCILQMHKYKFHSSLIHYEHLPSSCLILAMVKRGTLGNQEEMLRDLQHPWPIHGKYWNQSVLHSSAQWQKFWSPEYLPLFQRSVCSLLCF